MFSLALKNKNKILTFGLLLGTFSLLPDTIFASGAISETTQALMWSFVNNVMGSLLWLAGLLLNFAITEFVVGFGESYKTGTGFAIDTLWGRVRDVFNLLFIFALIYVGFKMVLNADDSSPKKMLGGIIIAALLINFSLFITKTIIDVSNVAGAQVAKAFLVDNEYQVSEKFTSLMNLSGIFAIQSRVGAPESAAKAAPGFAYIFGTMFLYVTAGFVFFAGGILLVIRFIVLNIYMLFSPVLFLGMIFPFFKSISDKFFKDLLARAFFAPVYLLMLYFSYEVLDSLSGSMGDKPELSAAFNIGGNVEDATAAVESTVMFFVIAIGFLVASIVVASKMGAEGSGAAMRLGKQAAGKVRRGAQKTLGAATAGMVARGGRNIVGRASSKLNKSASFNKFVAKMPGGKFAKKMATKAADASYDVRGVLPKSAQAEVGSGKKGGFDTQIKEKVKENDAFVKSLGTTKVKNDDGSYATNEISDRVDADITAEKSDPTTNYGKAAKEAAEAEAARGVANTTNDAAVAARKATADAGKIKIDDLQAKIAAAKTANNILEQNKLKTELKNVEDKLAMDLAAHDTQIESSGKDLKAKSTAAESTKNIESRLEEKTRASAESKIKYERALAFIKTQETKMAFYNSSKMKLMSVYTLGASGAAGARNKASLEDLKKTYGTDGVGAEEKIREAEAEERASKRHKELIENKNNPKEK